MQPKPGNEIKKPTYKVYVCIQQDCESGMHLGCGFLVTRCSCIPHLAEEVQSRGMQMAALTALVLL